MPNPPLPLLGRRAGRGVWAGAALPAVPGGGGGRPTPTYMAQNDPHVVLIILTTHMWGKFFFREKNFQAKICVPAPLVATSVLTQNKGPGTEAHFWNPPPPSSFAGHPCHPPPRKAIFGPPKVKSTKLLPLRALQLGCMRDAGIHPSVMQPTCFALGFRLLLETVNCVFSETGSKSSGRM